MNTSPERHLDETDFNPFLILQYFPLPSMLERGGDRYYEPRVLQSGAVEVANIHGQLFIFSAHELTINSRPLLDVAREAADTRAAIMTTIQ